MRAKREPPVDLQVQLVGDGTRAVVSFTPRASSLTAAEIRIALALVRGRSNAQIAGDHGVSPRTVANQVASVMRKLGASSRSEVAARFGIDDLT